MLYTVIERELRRIVENLEKERGKQKLNVSDLRASSFLAQVTKFIDLFFGPHLAECPHFQALCDLQKIRDCIVHCRGEVSLSRDKDYLLKLAKRRAGFRAWEGTDIVIEQECIKEFLLEAWRFFFWLFDELKWKLDESWNKNEWAQAARSQDPPNSKELP